MMKFRHATDFIMIFLLLGLMAYSVTGQAVHEWMGLAMLALFVLPFLKFPISTSAARLIHLSCGYWSFLLMSIHLGFHWSIFLGLGRKLRSGHPLPFAGRIVLRMIVGAVAIYGAVCFARQNIADYLLLRTEFVFFDYEKAPALVFAELLAMITLWTLLGYLLQRLAAMKRNAGDHNG